jgi:predicted outer membrane repeat protein
MSFNSLSSILISNCQFLACATTSSSGYAGALYASGVDSLVIKDTLFSGNSCIRHGGALYTKQNTTLEMDGVTFTNNTANGAGGAAALDSTTSTNTLLNMTITGNTSKSGGYNDGGGGLFLYGDGEFRIYDSLISGNIATNRAGGLDLQTGGPTLIMSNCTVKSNIALGQGGGGMYLGMSWGGQDEIIKIYNSTIYDNNAPNGDGGGITFNAASNAILVNCTISGNSAGRSGAGQDGGGIYHLSATGLKIYNSTIADNRAYNNGGGIYKGGAGTLDMYSVLVGGNTADNANPDISGTLGTVEYSLIQNTAGYSAGSETGNVTGQDPLLGTLADNGGATLTHSIDINGPAVDAGANPLGLAYDQRGIGYEREKAGTYAGTARTDIGAYETDTPLPNGTVFKFK